MSRTLGHPESAPRGQNGMERQRGKETEKRKDRGRETWRPESQRGREKQDRETERRRQRQRVTETERQGNRDTERQRERVRDETEQQKYRGTKNTGRHNKEPKLTSFTQICTAFYEIYAHMHGILRALRKFAP